MKGLLIACVMCLFASSGLAAEVQKKAPADVSSWAVKKEIPSSQKLKVHKFCKNLPWKHRREMGLTFRNIREVLREKQAAGELEGKDRTVVATEIAEQLLEENPGAFQAAIEDATKANPAFDWTDFMETVIALIERLIPLIMTLISLFS